MSAQCVVVDYGSGNVFSVMKALERCGADPVLTSDLSSIRAAERLILPGVGAFGLCAERLRSNGQDEAIFDFIRSGRPFLGICVGMQLLMDEGSEFGDHRGLGLISGRVERMELSTANEELIRVPLVGWHPVSVNSNQENEQGCLFKNTPEKNAFYFVHSYAVQPDDPTCIVATYEVESHSIVASIQKDNIFAVQFHPERSAQDGHHLLSTFLSL